MFLAGNYDFYFFNKEKIGIYSDFTAHLYQGNIREKLPSGLMSGKS